MSSWSQNRKENQVIPASASQCHVAYRTCAPTDHLQRGGEVTTVRSGLECHQRRYRKRRPLDYILSS